MASSTQRERPHCLILGRQDPMPSADGRHGMAWREMPGPEKGIAICHRQGGSGPQDCDALVSHIKKAFSFSVYKLKKS